MPGDQSWQARQQTGYDVGQFVLDWEAEMATRPHGKTSVVWKPGRDRRGHDVVTIHFAHADGGACHAHSQGIRNERPRALVVRVQPMYDALIAAWQRQQTYDFTAAMPNGQGWR